MNDSIIITALECCVKDNCDSCPLSFDNCNKNLARFALGLISRQQAEISRMKIIQDSADQFARDLCKERFLKAKPIADFEDLQDYISKEKAKAVRAFAEKLKEHSCNLTEYDEGGWSDTVSAVKVEDIDRLVGKMGCNDG